MINVCSQYFFTCRQRVTIQPKINTVSHSLNFPTALAYHLSANLPDYGAEIIFVSPDDFDEFRSEVYAKYKWDTRTARDRTIKKPQDLQQIIYRKSGELIGTQTLCANQLK